MRVKDYSLAIRVKDRPIDEYSHEGRTFVEGRKGSEYALEFKNHSKGRVLVIPSVDGLSPLDGSKATPESKGYIVKAGETLIIEGWTVSDNEASRFLFDRKDRSYGSHSSEGTTNAGVVGVLVYAEKPDESPKEIHHHHHDTVIVPATPVIPTFPQPVWPTYPPRMWYGVSSTGSPLASGATTLSATRSVSSNVASISADALSSIGATVSDTIRHGTSTGAPEEDDIGLGTGWGAKTEFKINHTTFNKGDMVAQLVIYYDTRRNLEKRGIQIVPMRYSSDLPEPFSGVGCKPPTGWQG